MNEAIAITPRKKHHVALFDEMLFLSRNILRAGDEENVGQIAQLILKRGEVLDSINKLDFPAIPGDDKTEMAGIMSEINLLEPEVQQKLAFLTRKLESKLSHIQESRDVISHYKVTETSQTTRINQA